ncbi:cytochrome c3 family protein [Phosphitispora sp. TUW77]|uniref:cytochrome c3 family protein n=1 Tax=Phosphitispora sp. TUW77 TaxID=3152361 RepID=UPI003AB11F4D
MRKKIMLGIGLILIIAVVIGYQILGAGAAEIIADMLNDEGDFENLNPPNHYSSWLHDFDSGGTSWTYDQDTATVKSGVYSAGQSSTIEAGFGITARTLNGGYRYSFTTPDVEEFTASLSLYYDKNIAIVPGAMGTTNVSKCDLKWEVRNSAGTSIVDTGAVIDSATTSVSWGGTPYSDDVTGLEPNTAYQLRIFVDAVHQAQRSGVSGIDVHWDDVVLNAVYTDNPPTIGMSSPADLSSQKGTVSLSAYSIDDFGVSQVDFEYADNTSFTGATTLSGAALSSGTTKDGIWGKNWDTTGLNGTYYVRAKADDGVNDVVTSGSYFTYYIDNTAPSTAAMSSPADSAYIRSVLDLEAAATDNMEVSSVDFQWADNALFSGAQTVTGATLTLGTVTDGTWTASSFNTSTMGDGTRYVRAVVYDSAGNSLTGSYITVVADNTAPTLDLDYYSDSALTEILPVSGGIPLTVAQTVYVVLNADETLSPDAGDNQISIDAIGIDNDISNANFTWDGTAGAWVYPWIVSAGSDGDTIAITVKGTDLAGNVTTGAPNSGDVVRIDTTEPVLSLEYYSDSGLTTALPVSSGKPVVKAGTTYIKLVTNESLSTTPGVNAVTIDAPGGANDITDEAFTWDAGTSAWKYAWTVSIADDGDSSGISVTGKDAAGNTYTGAPSSGETVTLATIPAPYALQISAVPTSVPYDDTSTATVTAVLTDQYGDVMEGVTVDFTTTLGTFVSSGTSSASETTDATGSAAVSLKSGSSGIATVTGTANGTTVSDSVQVTFYPPAQTIGMTILPDDIPANNTTCSIVTAEIKDSGGTPLPDGTLITFEISAGTGTFDDETTTKQAAISGGLGKASVQVKSDTVGTVTVRASLDGSNNTTDINFVAQEVTTVETSATPTTIDADGSEQATVTAALFDQYGVPMQSELTVTFTTTLGDLYSHSAVTDLSGEAVVTLTSVSAGEARVKAIYSPNGVSDYVDITILVPDNTPPGLIKAEATSKQIIYLTFTEPICFDPDPPVNWGVYKYISGDEYTVSFQAPEIIASDRRIAKLTLAEGVYHDTGNQYPNPERYKIVVSGVYDLRDNVIDEVYNYTYWDSYTPHGKYSKVNETDLNNTMMCGQCHSAHSAVGVKLLNKTTIQQVCFVCHGTGGISDYNVYEEFTDRKASGSTVSYTLHKSLDDAGNDFLYCSDCHNPHGDKRTGTNNIYPKLLRVTNVYGTVYNQGNGFCLGCHGDGAEGMEFGTSVTMAIYWDDLGGNHAWGMGVDGDALGGTQPIPHYSSDYDDMHAASETDVTCVLCHERHGSQYRSLIDNTLVSNDRDDLCFKCHNASTPNTMSGEDIEAKFALANTHEINDPLNTGLTCSGCHGPHSVAARWFADSGSTAPSAITDPENTKENWYKSDTQDMAGFCNKCHNVADTGGTPSYTESLTAVTSADKIRPFTIEYDSLSLSNFGFSWNKKEYFDITSTTKAGHYSPTRSSGQDAVMCDNCHDPHGSDYDRLSLYDEDVTGGPASDGMCLRCHGDITGTPGDDDSSLDVWTNGFDQSSKHPIFSSTGVHSDTENLGTAARHVECVDCHDPHAAREDSIDNLSGPLLNVSGVTRSGGSLEETDTATEDWEVCYKCHSDYWGNLDGSRDIAAEFYRTATIGSTSGVYSFHFVELTSNTNASANVASHLTAGAVDHDGNAWTNTSKMYCTDCHGTSSGAAGPHGSPNPALLKGSYNTTIETRSGLPSDFICFLCHDETWYKGSHAARNPAHIVACKKCHGVKVHGANRAHIIRTNNPADESYDSESLIDSAVAHPDEMDWTDCTSSDPACSTKH